MAHWFCFLDTFGGLFCHSTTALAYAQAAAPAGTIPVKDLGLLLLCVVVLVHSFFHVAVATYSTVVIWWVMQQHCTAVKRCVRRPGMVGFGQKFVAVPMLLPSVTLLSHASALHCCTTVEQRAVVLSKVTLQTTFRQHCSGWFLPPVQVFLLVCTGACHCACVTNARKMSMGS
jgi:hypothetical protein